MTSHLAPPQAPSPAPCTAPANTQVLVTPLQRLLVIYRTKPKLLTFAHLSSLIPYNVLSYPRLPQPHRLGALAKLPVSRSCMTHLPSRRMPCPSPVPGWLNACAFCYIGTNHFLLLTSMQVFP